MKTTTYWTIAFTTCFLIFGRSSAISEDHPGTGQIKRIGNESRLGHPEQTARLKQPASPEQPARPEQPDSLSTKIRERESAENAVRQRLIELIDSTQENVLLEFLNCGTRRDLESIAGVASVRAEALIEERPFHNLSEVAKVRGIGLRTFVKIVKHLELLEGGGAVALDRSEVEALVCK